MLGKLHCESSRSAEWTSGKRRRPQARETQGIGKGKGSLIIQSNSTKASHAASPSQRPAVTGRLGAASITAPINTNRATSPPPRGTVRPSGYTPPPLGSTSPPAWHPGRSQSGPAVRPPLKQDRQPFGNFCVSGRGPTCSREGGVEAGGQWKVGGCVIVGGDRRQRG